MTTDIQPYQPVRARINKVRLYALRRELLMMLDYVQRLLGEFPGNVQSGYVDPSIVQQLNAMQQTLASMETQLMPATSATTGKLPEFHPREPNTEPIPLSQRATGPLPPAPYSRDGWLITHHPIGGDLPTALKKAVAIHQQACQKRAQYIHLSQINRWFVSMLYKSKQYEDEQGQIDIIVNPDLGANEAWCATYAPTRQTPTREQAS